MDEVTRRRISLAKASGAADGAYEIANGLRAEIKVCLGSEDFSVSLTDEVEAMRDRLAAICRDLHMIAQVADDVNCENARYRLANRGAAKPDWDAEREQSSAIEEVAA